MRTSDTKRVDEIRAREHAATRGEWVWCYYDGFLSLEAFDENGEAVADVARAARPEDETTPGPFLNWINISRTDADFIEAARADIPWLLDELIPRLLEDFRIRVIRAMGGLRVTTDQYECVDLVDLDAVLDAIRAVPAVVG